MLWAQEFIFLINLCGTRIRGSQVIILTRFFGPKNQH